MPQISVLMLAYNADKYIYDSIQSILKQSFEDFELIVYNDGSTDRTSEVVKGIFDPRIRFIDNKVNMGLSHARISSLKEAKCKYVAILDSDDLSFPNRLKIQYEFMEGHPEVALCGGNAVLIDQQGHTKNKKLHKTYKKHNLKAILFFNNIFVNSSIIFRREVVNKLGGYHDMAPVEDYELFVRIADQHDFHLFNEPLVYYRIHDDNISKKRYDLAVERLNKVKELQLSQLGLDGNRFGTVFNSMLLYDFNKFDIKEYQTLLKELKIKNRNLAKFPASYFERRLFSMWYDLVITKAGKKNALPFLLDKNMFSLKILTWKQLGTIVKLSIKSWFKK